MKSLYSVIFCFLKSAFIFNLHAYVWCVFMSACYMNTYVDAVSQWSIDSLELNLQTLVNWLMWVLESHLCCSIGVHTSLTVDPISDVMFGNSIKYNLQFLEAFLCKLFAFTFLCGHPCHLWLLEISFFLFNH